MCSFPKSNLSLSKWIISQAARRSYKPHETRAAQNSSCSCDNFKLEPTSALGPVGVPHCFILSTMPRAEFPEAENCSAVSLQIHERGGGVFSHSFLITYLPGKWFDTPWPGKWEGAWLWINTSAWAGHPLAPSLCPRVLLASWVANCS